MFYRKFFQKISLPTLLALIPALLLGLTHGALAQVAPSGGAAALTRTLGDVFVNLCASTHAFNPLITWVCYAAGVAFAIQGIYQFRMHAEKPREVHLTTPMMLMLGSMFLLTLPAFVAMLVSTIQFTLPVFGGVTFMCQGPQAIAAGSTGSGVTLDVMMTNFIGNIKNPILSLISMIAFVLGLYMIVRGLFKASKYGFDPRTHAMHLILINMLFGALLLAIGSNMATVTNAVFGGGAVAPGSVIQWATLSSVSPQFANAVTACLQFVQIIGAIAFVRGWLILKKVAEGNGQTSLAQGLTHIVGGVLAINIFIFLPIMDSTFGLGLLN